MSIGKCIVFVVAALPLFLPAALSSAVPDTHDPIEPHVLITHARAMVDQLAQRGRVDGPVQIEAGRDLGSTARADFDFVTGACRVRIDPESAAVHYPAPAALRFLVYHELSHCEFYRRPGGLFRHAELSGRDARLLDDFVLLDALDADDPEDRLNLYPLAHETYADLRAAALLIEEGADREVLRRIAAMRSDASFDRYHATGPALARLMTCRRRRSPACGWSTTVRALAGEHVVAVGIRPIFRPHARVSDGVLAASRKPPGLGPGAHRRRPGPLERLSGERRRGDRAPGGVSAPGVGLRQPSAAPIPPRGASSSMPGSKACTGRGGPAPNPMQPAQR